MRKNDLLTRLYKENIVELRASSTRPLFKDKIFNDVNTKNQISKLYSFFELSFGKIAKKYKAQPFIPSTLIRKHVLQKADYFISFPNIALSLDDQWYLNPAVCYHTYNLFEKKQIDTCEYVSLMGQCFRQEKTYEYLQRMKNFSMFEVVAIGEYEKVEKFRKSLLVDIFTFAEKLNLSGRLERAYDPFFVNDDNKGKIFLQKLSPLKFELKIKTDEENFLAVASFNNHQDFFGKRFRISLRDKSNAHSVCVAFGIERWVYAFLSHYGLNEKTWPGFVNLQYASKIS